MIHLTNANIMTAFNSQTVGTKVTQRQPLEGLLLEAIAATDFAAQRQPGQAFIPLPDAAKAMVSAGVGSRSNNPDHYVIRTWRDSVSCYLKREYAAPVSGVAAVIYTVEAYRSDPDVQKDEAEMLRTYGGRCATPTHVLVALLAFAGPKAPLSPGRFVSNLAGGNKEALLWSGDEIRAMAKEIIAYNDAWSVVSD